MRKKVGIHAVQFWLCNMGILINQLFQRFPGWTEITAFTYEIIEEKLFNEHSEIHLFVKPAVWRRERIPCSIIKNGRELLFLKGRMQLRGELGIDLDIFFEVSEVGKAPILSIKGIEGKDRYRLRMEIAQLKTSGEPASWLKFGL